MTVDEELELIRRVLDGDANAFEGLVLANQKNVYNLALKLTNSEQDALDLSQEAFIKAYRLLGSFRGESRFTVWLYRLTYNLCLDFLRKKTREKTVPITYQNDDDEAFDLEIPDMRSLPEDSVMHKELRETLAASVNELNPQHREIFVMREITGMSYAEIAETLGLSDGTVKSRLARARLSLANILMKKGTFPESLRHIEQGKEAE